MCRFWQLNSIPFRRFTFHQAYAAIILLLPQSESSRRTVSILMWYRVSNWICVTLMVVKVLWCTCRLTPRFFFGWRSRHHVYFSPKINVRLSWRNLIKHILPSLHWCLTLFLFILSLLAFNLQIIGSDKKCFFSSVNPSNLILFFPFPFSLFSLFSLVYPFFPLFLFSLLFLLSFFHLLTSYFLLPFIMIQPFFVLHVFLALTVQTSFSCESM